ncbi:MAG: hypothetical protein OWQ55_08395, partial [Sulfuracidifex metallicus]|nr:hypothetical protein [Sulfuracidifex metallicus]
QYSMARRKGNPIRATVSIKIGRKRSLKKLSWGYPSPPARLFAPLTPSFVKISLKLVKVLCLIATIIETTAVGPVAIIGAGIFVLSGAAIYFAGSYSIIAFLFIGFLSVLIAMSLGEFTTMFPHEKDQLIPTFSRLSAMS